jgi:hypothetical protein
MIKPIEHAQHDEIGTLSAIGQLTTIVAPLLYLLGRKYASAYFDSLGCGWATSHLTLQETIFYALPTTMPILAAIFFSLEILLNGTSYASLRKTLIYIFITLLAVITACNFFWNFNYLDAILRLFAYGFFISFGIYISEIFLAVKRNDASNLKSAIAWVVGSTAVIYGTAATLGSIDANRALDSAEKNFPLLTKGATYGRPQALRLVSKIGDKYLLIDQSNGENFFRMESNIDGYTIHQLDGIR